ncbi:MAG: type II toxin-antitoxin system RelE/ParE family toxin [Candidatus Liptonbacteria bacterium]|nr:type II toxin-antitoxin system RelE/ParE family toxin [Candidatus Liptonbacteria bacterium]
MYTVFIERRAERDIDKLDIQVRRRFIACFLRMAMNPRENAKKLEGSKNAWRVRSGDWRAIYEIDDKRKEIKIYRVKHRSKAY